MENKKILIWERRSYYSMIRGKFCYTFLLLDWSDPLGCTAEVVAKVSYESKIRGWYWAITEVKMSDTLIYALVPIAHGYELSLREACRTAKRAYLYPKPEQKPTRQMTLPLAE